eukprot:Sspe_Gene.18798::Locus_6791_Transcript_1_1_Confidence_1.000_Length_606::g.18798::m.18798/K02942/RP-LP1, RPLP1; large subunit ribosomal protein LP1
MSLSELACTYAALILHDEGLEITSKKIETLCKAADVPVEGFYPTMFATFLASTPMDSLLTNMSAAPAAAAAQVAGGQRRGRRRRPRRRRRRPPPRRRSRTRR